MEERSNTENLGESRHHISEKKNEIHKVEMFLGELLAARYGVEPEQAVDLPAYLGLVGYSLGSWLILLVACP